jgi:hypothetical protein
MYDGTQTVQLPDGVGIGQSPRTDGANVTGELFDDTSHNIGVTRYNITTGQLSTYPSEIRYSSTPYISGAQMAWAVYLDDTFQLFALNSQGIPVQLTDAGFKYGPYVSDSFVAWTRAAPEGGIFTFDGKSISRFPNADAFTIVTDADKNSLVLLQPDGLTSDIILATYIAPEPSSIAMAGIALVGCFFLARKDRPRGHIRSQGRPLSPHGHCEPIPQLLRAT